VSQPGDYREQPGQGRGPEYTRAAGFGPQGQDPGRQSPATPPPWGGQQPDPWAGSVPGGQPQYPPQPSYQPPPQHQQPHQPPGYGPQFPPPGPYQRQPRKSRKGLLAGLGCGGLFLVVLIAVIAGASSSSSTPPAATQQPANAASAPAAQDASQAPARSPAGAPANTKPAGTVSELEALTAAKGYLSDGQGFSRQGLIDQLDSSFGSNFSVADATWGVDHSGANWDDQAVDCAKGYISDGQGFSRQGLIDQMTSAYGNKFTEAEAEYAANAVGL
jgi:Host cell surface-exposed lipoprotein